MTAVNDWLEVTVETTDQEMEALAARLTMNGAEGLVLENETDFKLFLGLWRGSKTL